MLSPWFKSLKNPTFGFDCCATADCRNYPVLPTEHGYMVLFEGKLIPVPPEAISDRTDNPTGDYVTCLQRDFWISGVKQPPIIRCFFRAPRT